MSSELKIPMQVQNATQPGEPEGPRDGNRSEGPGASPVGPAGIVSIASYLIILSFVILYSLVQFWPSGGTETVLFLFWTFSLSEEIRLLFIVALAGALGSLVHGLRSLSWYVGNRMLIRSWLVMYILRPLVGATLALVFYLVIRGGFFSAQATVEETSPFGFAALAGLVGLFSEQAAEKLKQVAATLLTESPKGEDTYTPQAKRDKQPAMEPSRTEEVGAKHPGAT